jgi:hypothetical protein
MISRSEAKKLVKRFSGLPGFPKDEDGVDPLIDAMMTATNLDKASVFTTSWLFDEATAPTPSHIYRYFHPTKTPEQSNTAPLLAAARKCPFCKDVPGWIIGVDYAGNSTAWRCQCAKDAIGASLGH